ncbi:MAG: hypothetical protein ACOYN0_18450 [Phycisphaerales bacterium]
MGLFQSEPHTSTEQPEECSKCGYMGTSGRDCPRCGHRIAPNVAQVFVDPFLDVLQAPFKGNSRAQGSSAGCSSAVVGLLGLTLAAWAIYFFLTVILPILLMIAAGIFALWLTVKIFRICVKRFGLATTVKGFAIFFGLAIGGPLTFIWYREHFMGDFEADHASVTLRSSPASSASQCSVRLDEGNNLSCSEKDCAARDTLEGRWIAVERDGETCWAAYRDVRYQRGIVMWLVNHVVALRSTRDDDARIVEEQRTLLARRVDGLFQQRNWQGFVELSGPIIAAGVQVPVATAVRIEEGLSRARYAEALARLESANPTEREPFIAFARALPAPAEKPELDAFTSRWRRDACDAALRSTREASSIESAARLLLASAPSCEGNSTIDSIITGLLDRIAADTALSPERRLRFLELLATDAMLGARLQTPTRERVSSMFAETRRSVDEARQAALVDVRHVEPEALLAARCASDGSQQTPEPTEERNVVRASRIIQRNVQRDARTYLRALMGGDPTLPALREASFATSTEDELRPGLQPLDQRWRVEEITVDPCGHRASLFFVRGGGRHAPARRVPLAMCFQTVAHRWDPCGPSTQRSTGGSP